MTQQSARDSAFKNEPLLDVDSKILRAYQAALGAYNASNWDGTVIACAKVLEEVAKTELPYNERSGTLGQLLEKLPKHLKTDQPVLDLAAAIKDGKRLGAHFDLAHENDAELAQATLSLIESFITYSYLLKNKVAHLIELMEKTSQTETTTTPPTATSPQNDPPAIVLDDEHPASLPDTPPAATRSTQQRSRPNHFENFDKTDPFDTKNLGWKKTPDD